MGEPDECWPWTGGTNLAGYGIINVKGSQGWTPRLAHRVAWELANGPIPEGTNACHSCDNPPCCNPAHLFLGTPAENHADMVQKGRARGPSVRGEQHWSARLTDADVMAIRERYRIGGISQRGLAAEFGVTQARIQQLVTGKAR